MSFSEIFEERTRRKPLWAEPLYWIVTIVRENEMLGDAVLYRSHQFYDIDSAKEDVRGRVYEYVKDYVTSSVRFEVWQFETYPAWGIDCEQKVCHREWSFVWNGDGKYPGLTI